MGPVGRVPSRSRGPIVFRQSIKQWIFSTQIKTADKSEDDEIEQIALLSCICRQEDVGAISGMAAFWLHDAVKVTSNISAFTFQFFCFAISSCRLRAVD